MKYQISKIYGIERFSKICYLRVPVLGIVLMFCFQMLPLLISQNFFLKAISTSNTEVEIKFSLYKQARRNHKHQINTEHELSTKMICKRYFQETYKLVSEGKNEAKSIIDDKYHFNYKVENNDLKIYIENLYLKTISQTIHLRKSIQHDKLFSSS